MKELKITIENLKKINKLEFIIKLEKGLYAIIGNNGSGKSSLIISIAKLVRPSILNQEFSGSGNRFVNSKITYTNAYGFDIVWRKNPNWNAVENYEKMPSLKGFFESSILTGTRFHHLDNKKVQLKSKDIENSKEASEFVRKNLDYIINGIDTSHFKNLYYVNFGKDNKLYYIKFDEENYVDEFNLSTGEYFLLSILKIIQTFSNRRQTDDLRILIIDEIDIALHPMAQRRFIEKLKEWMIEYNLLVVFATHSLQIINSLSAKEIYYIEDGNIFNPIYPSYLTSKLFEHTSYDKVILVEDDLAIRFIEKVLRDLKYERFLLKIIPIGGWEKVLEIYSQNEKFKYFGKADTLVILDGDIISEANKKPHKIIPKVFLPFNNIERYCIEKLFKCNNFIIFIEKIIYPTKIKNINIEEINEDEFKVSEVNTDKIKKIFRKLVNELSNYSNKENIDILNKLINYLYEDISNNTNYERFLKYLKAFLDK